MPLRVAAFIAAVCIALAVSCPVMTSVAVKQRENAAALRLQAVFDAQRAFRASAGQGGYATTLTSLTARCPEGQPATLPATLTEGEWLAGGYRTSLRSAGDAPVTGLDCHGQPTTEDFIASASPLRPGADGLRAFSVQAAGRVYLFFDGVPPAERDMAPGGLAMPLDALTRIP